MAQSQYTVDIRATDNISSVIQGVKKSLKDMGRESSAIEDVSKRFEQIVTSSAPIKKQLRDIQKIMAEMNLKGLDNTAVFTEMAQYAGSLRDAMGDASMAVNAFANDTFKLQAAAQGFQLVASAGSIATGVMGMFGTENEKLQRTLLKVQSAMAVLNGVQSIANLLNKDSALLHRIKQIRLAATTRAKVADTAATTANTVAEGANTAATAASTIAQNAWNVAKAVAKALLGDWTGLVLVGAVALTTYALATDDSTEKTKKNTDAVNRQAAALERQKERMKKYSDAVNSSASSMITSYKMLQYEWKQLATENEKVKWIEKNQEAFRKLGIQINSVTQAENAFIKNSGNMINALMLRAAQDSLTDLMKSYVDDYVGELTRIQTTVAGGGKKYTAKAGGKIPNAFSDAELKKVYDEWATERQKTEGENFSLKKYVTSSGEWTQEGAESFSWFGERRGRDLQKKNKAAADKAFQEGQKYIEDLAGYINKKLESLGIKDIFVKSDGTPTPSIPHQSTSSGKATDTSKGETPLKDSLQYWRNIRSEQEKIMNFNPVGSDAFDNALKEYIEADKQVKGLEEKMKALRGESEKTKAVIVGSLEDIDRKLKEANDKLKEFTIDTPQETVDAQKEVIKALQQQRKDLEERLKIEEEKIQFHYTIETKEEPEETTKGSIWDKRASLTNANSIIDETKSDLKNGIISISEAQSIIDDINEKLSSIGLKPLDLTINVETKDIEDKLEILQRKTESLSSVSDSISTIGNAFNSLGQSIEGTTGQIVSFGGTVISQGAQMVSQLAQIIVANQAAALAKGISSASGLQFPFNLAAIATVVGAIASIFASLPKFASGGIVGGSSYAGDRIPVLANSGEMILSKRQQGNLFHLLDSGAGTAGGGGGQVVFRIKGPELVGVLDNYNRKMNKAR